MRERPPDRAVVELAATHHQVVTWPQLRAAGLGRHQVAHRVAVGWLHRIHRGVYLVGDPKTATRMTLFAAAVALAAMERF